MGDEPSSSSSRPKAGKRLKAIVNAYTFSPRYREVLFIVRSAALGRQIADLARSAAVIGGNRTKVRVLAWSGLPAEQRAALTVAIERRVGIDREASVPMSEQALRATLGY